MLREQVLKVWEDLKESVLSWKEVWEENDREQGKRIYRLKERWKTQMNDLTELKNSLEEKRKYPGIALDFAIAQIKCLLPDEP